MFKGMNLNQFNRRFQNEDDCKQYLYHLKWKKEYRCKRCNNDKFWQGRTWSHARCTKCNYDESVTANTVFHKIQFPILKAFSIVFHVTVYKKGITSQNMSEIVNVNQKTAWFFMKKIQNAMGTYVSSRQKTSLPVDDYHIDGIILTHRGKHLNGIQRVGLILQQSKTGIKKIRFFQCKSVNIDPAMVDPCQLVSGKYIHRPKSILLWNFKSWLTGMHHHCSAKYLDGYLNEFSFRLNLRKKKKMIWHTLIEWMMRSKPFTLSGTAA